MSIGHQSELKKYLWVVVVILVLILIYSFVSYVEKFEKTIEITALEKKVHEINALLTLKVVEELINGATKDLADYHHSNPFEIVSVRDNVFGYLGVVNNINRSNKKGGWYFEKENQTVFFISPIDNEMFLYQLNFIYQDVDKSGSYDPGIDKSISLILKKK